MEYPELCWIDTAVGGPNKRGAVRDVRTWRPPADAVDVYRSVFRFGPEFRDHARRQRSVAGYEGVAYADYLPIDIDAEGDLHAALGMARDAVERIGARTDVDLDALHLYLSGSKGFHIQVPTPLFQPTPAGDLHRVFGRMVEQLLGANGYDPSVYDLLRIFRVAGTKHGKSGLYKTPLTLAELRTLSATEIVELARVPRRVQYHESVPGAGMLETYAEARASASENPGRDHGATPAGALSPMARPCVAEMLKGVQDPGRHDAALRIAAHLSHQGLGTSEIEAALVVWNAKNRPPMDERRAAQELAKIARDAARYDFGCNDPIRIRFCGGVCQLKTAREAREKARCAPAATTASDQRPAIVGAQDAYRRYVQFAQDSKERVVKLGFPTIDKAIRGIRPGDVCEIVARAGVGKTALLVNIARNMALLPSAAVLFVTLEMDVAALFERSVQVTAKVTADEAEQRARGANPAAPEGVFAETIEAFQRVYYADRDSMRMEDLEALVLDAPKAIGRPLSAVLVDYLGRMRSSRSGQREYDLMSELALRMKSLAKAANVPIIYLHQVSRDHGGDGSTPLTMDSGRGSGVTEEAVDVVIGLWRPDGDATVRAEVETLDMAVLKARHGKTALVRVIFAKQHMTMGEIAAGPTPVVPMRSTRRRRRGPRDDIDDREEVPLG